MKDDTFDIPKMLKVLKIEKGTWDKIVPLAFYLHPLKEAL